MRRFPALRLAPLLVPALVCALAADLGLTGPLLPALALVAAAALAFADRRALNRAPEVTLERKLGKGLPVGVWSPMTLILRNAGPGPFKALVSDRLPPGMELDPPETRLTLRAGGRAEIACRVRPNRRGDFILPGADALADSPWGLWRERRLLPCEQSVRVFPNFRELKRYTLMARNDQLSRMGIKQRALRGTGQEFFQLREYEPGDALRQIDWKATSRFRRLISRENQDEHEQHIVVALDCTRRMRHVESGLSQFDQALNSALLLAHVAARQGDSVGLLACGERTVWHEPGKKAEAARRLLLAGARLFPDQSAMDYRALARELGARLKRRSLVILLTNSRAEDYEDLAVLARQTSRRHLLVIADLLEQEAADALARQPADAEEALRWQALFSHRRERRLFALRLRRLGCLALDLTARELPPALVNTYLDIRGRKRV